MRRFPFLFCVILTLSLLAQGVRGQQTGDAAPGLVTGVGTATLKRLPDVLRVQVQIGGEGKTLKDALAKLAARREACRKKLLALGAVEASIAFEDAKPDGAADPRVQAAMMMRARMNRGGARPPTTGPATGGAGGATPQRVAAVVKAEWTLTATTGEDLLVAASELQERIKAADLADTRTASLEEQELREERAGMNEDGEQGPPPGEPGFLYVAKLPADQRTAALADAFKKAKAGAAELARSAGAELGGLKQLQSQSMPDVDAYQMMQYGRYNPYLYQQSQQNADPSEAVAPQPGPVTLRLTVSASFALK